MKLLVVCALLPIAFCLPKFPGEEKWKADIEFLAQKFASSDLTRQACEEECQKYIEDDDNKEANIEFACPLACAGLQLELKKVISAAVENHHSKRAASSSTSWLTQILHHFHIDNLILLEMIYPVDTEKLKHELQIALNVIGGHPAEQVCENECHFLVQHNHAPFGTDCKFFCQTKNCTSGSKNLGFNKMREFHYPSVSKCATEISKFLAIDSVFPPSPDN